MSASQLLKHLYSINTSSPDFSRLLYGLIRQDEEEKYLSSLNGSELARLVDFLDNALSVIPATDDVSLQCLHKLQAICGHHMILPSSYTVSGEIARIGDRPVALGGFADVWEGTHSGKQVCVKLLRVSLNDGETLNKSFFREAVIWKRLRHPNVVPFIGVTREPLQIVSEWMPNGTLTNYVERNPGANRIGLLLDVAEGLNYLHANFTIHGDLKGPNILVDGSGHARLTDFGLATIVRGLNSGSVTQAKGYTAAWAAPEILQGGDKATREGDIFAFGMVVIEAFTGRFPFSDFKPQSIILKITGGERPTRPQEAQRLGLVDSVWEMTLSCWDQDPTRRPTMAGVVGFLLECYTLRAVNPSSSTLAPWRPAGKADDGMNCPPISLTPPNVKSATSQPSSPREVPGNLNPTFNIPRSGDFEIDDNREVSASYLRSENLTLEELERRINGVAKELARGNVRSKGKTFIELRKLCGHHRIVPASYKLEGVVKEGGRAQRISQVTEIWKGRYNDEVVALKILRVPRDDPHVHETKSRFCKEVVLMKQVKHDNILPFYGVSTTVSDFCMVFPWYENGGIMDYLKKKPDISRFDLLLDAANGLRFLHESRLVHGGLRPSNVLIDDNGVARLATSGRSSIVAVPGTSIAGHIQSGGDIDNYRYSAPEIQWPEDHGTDDILITKESDVYGMGMVVYEVLTGNIPYAKHNDAVTLSVIQAGEIPQKPSEGMDGTVWEFLEKCWSRDVTKRPSSHQVYDSIFRFRSLPQVIPALGGRLEMEELPGKLRLQVQSIRISLNKPKQHQLCVKIKYGSRDYTTAPTMKAVGGSDEYVWSNPEAWLIETNQQFHGQLVSFEVILRTSILKKYRVCATGNFSLLNNVNKRSYVKLEGQNVAGSAVLKILLTRSL